MRALVEDTKKLTLNNNDTNEAAKQFTMKSSSTAIGHNHHHQQNQPQQQHNQHNNNHGSTTITIPKANSGDDIAGGVQDTIYLCNFRVSVDGEWLCLKELQDLDIHQDTAGYNRKPSSNQLEENNGTKSIQYGVTPSLSCRNENHFLTAQGLGLFCGDWGKCL